MDLKRLSKPTEEKEEMEKRYRRELTQTTIVSAVLLTLSLSTFLLNSLVGRSLRAPQIDLLENLQGAALNCC